MGPGPFERVFDPQDSARPGKAIADSASGDPVQAERHTPDPSSVIGGNFEGLVPVRRFNSPADVSTVLASLPSENNPKE
jgi:hypothetical protein